jgi:hypothetical protein
MKRRMLALVGALSLAALLMVMVLWLPNLEMWKPPDVTSTSETIALAVVNGEQVALDMWRQQYLLDQVMSRLTGQPTPTPAGTLDRLINNVLLLQAYPSDEVAADQDVARHIAQLKTAWGFDEAILCAHLEAAGLSREVLTRTIAQLLAVEAAQAQLEATGADPEMWLQDARRRAKLQIDESLFADITPPLAPTPTPHPDR